MGDLKPVKYEQEIPEIMQALTGVHQILDTQGFDRTIHHLVVLRASQINNCAFCVKMHLREAREDGETNDRLDRVVVWRHVKDFNARERAALAWTEALTVLDEKVDLGGLRAELRQHFSDKEIGVLTAEIGMINLWNRINVSKH